MGRVLFASLASSSALESVSQDRMVMLAEHYRAESNELAKSLLAKLSASRLDQSAHLEDVLRSLPSGDVRKGQRIFHNEKLACFTCHAIGYRGGTVGPDLSRIGRTRSKREMSLRGWPVVRPNATLERVDWQGWGVGLPKLLRAHSQPPCWSPKYVSQWNALRFTRGVVRVGEAWHPPREGSIDLACAALAREIAATAAQARRDLSGDPARVPDSTTP